ncbi:MAG TPA: hypothetical protein VIF60_12215 [Burkholderiaceae bacterium]|jgi:hypothetical protein
MPTPKATTKPAAVAAPAAAPKKAAPVKQPAAAKKPAVAKKAAPAAKPAAAKKPVAKVTKAAGTIKAPKPPKVAKVKAEAIELPKVKKAKLVRDSFSMPEPEYAVLGAVKKACLKAGVEVKKSELLRIGVALIQKMDVAGLKAVLATLPPLKAGRPKSK